jgi:hypothetical protein
MSYAAKLGADPALFVRCQWVRFPGGTRTDNGRRQPVIYFRPDLLDGYKKVTP